MNDVVKIVKLTCVSCGICMSAARLQEARRIWEQGKVTTVNLCISKTGNKWHALCGVRNYRSGDVEYQSLFRDSELKNIDDIKLMKLKAPKTQISLTIGLQQNSQEYVAQKAN